MSMKYSVKSKNIGVSERLTSILKLEQWLKKNDVIVLDIISHDSDVFVVTYLKS